MKTFLLYRLESGEIVGSMTVPLLYAQDIPQGCWAVEGNADIRTHRCAVEVDPWNPPIVPLPEPPPPPIEPHEVNAVRDRLEQSPVTANGARYDYDTVARERMARAIAQWDYITQTKVDGKIAWKDADNQIGLFTKAELIDLRDALEVAFAARADRLHAHARMLVEQLPGITQESLEIDQWPM